MRMHCMRNTHKIGLPVVSLYFAGVGGLGKFSCYIPYALTVYFLFCDVSYVTH